MDTFRQSILRQQQPTPFKRRGFSIVVPESEAYCCSFNQFLGFGNRRVVMKASAFDEKGKAQGNGKDTDLLIKFPLFAFRDFGIAIIDQELMDEARKEMGIMMNELKNLKSFGGENNGIVTLARGFEDRLKMIVMEGVGVSLNRIVCSGNAGKLLAKVVHRDIWGVALSFLEKKGICHADIHEGNICIRVDVAGGMMATLVDLESALPYKKELRLTPIKNRTKQGKLFFENAAANWDRASACSVLACLWREDLSLQDIKEKTGVWVAWFKERKNPKRTQASLPRFIHGNHH